MSAKKRPSGQRDAASQYNMEWNSYSTPQARKYPSRLVFVSKDRVFFPKNTVFNILRASFLN